MYQLVLVIGSIMLVSLLTVSVNNSIINKTIETYESESIVAMTTLGQSLIQEISLREFDEKTIGAGIDSSSVLTPVGSLGKEAGESFPNFDDIDDYNNYSRFDTLSNGIFKSSVEVRYIDAAAKGAASAVPTFYKRVAVTVTDTKGMSLPITLSNIISY